MDCREGEPDRTGAAATFEGFFDLETGEPRRSGHGVPRLRLVQTVRSSPAAPASGEPPSTERVWGFECWWRPDPTNTGLTEADRLELEQSKQQLRGLLRDSRRSTRPREIAAAPPPR